MRDPERIERSESPKETFGQALSASVPPMIRDCFGPLVEQVGLLVFKFQEETVPTDPEKKQKK